MSDEPPNVMRLADFVGGTADATEALRQPLPLLTLEELRQQSQNTAWLVKHVVPAESVGVLYGAPGTFKSFIGLDLVLSVAHGISWLGRKTKRGPVIVIAAEGGAGLWRRIVAWHRERRLPWKDACVYVVPVAVDLSVDAALVREAAAAIGVTPVMVLIDTLSQTFNGEENSAQDVSRYLRELGLQFRACWQCAVLMVHHTGHNATERPRGSSALQANVDFMFGVFRDEKEMLATLECTKQKDDDLFPPVSFAMKVCDLAFDEDGEAITSLVATEINSQGQVLDAMQHEASRGRGGHNFRFLELAVDGIQEKKLRTLFYETCDGETEAKRRAYSRARKWAESSGHIEIAQGFVIRLEQPQRSGTQE